MTVQHGKGKRDPSQANAFNFADSLLFEEEPDMCFDIGATRTNQDASATPSVLIRQSRRGREFPY
jgi:hypothetical protein